MCDLWPVMLQVHSDPFSGCYILPTKKNGCTCCTLLYTVHRMPQLRHELKYGTSIRHPTDIQLLGTCHRPPPNSVVSSTHRPSSGSNHQSAPAVTSHPVIPSSHLVRRVGGPSWRTFTRLHFWTSAFLASFMACLRLHSLVSSWRRTDLPWDV